MVWLLALLGMLAVYQIAVIALTAIVWRNAKVPPGRTPETLGVPFSDIRFPTSAGRTLHGWWIPRDGSRRPALVLVHGWGRNAERMLPYVGMLKDRGYHLLAFDARNHGLSDRDAPASMKKFSEDIRAAVDALVLRPEVDPERIGVVGLSVGGSAAIHAAAHDARLRAVVTVGAFADPRDSMLAVGFGKPWLAPAMPLTLRFVEWRIGARFDELAPERQIARVAGRVLLVHGEEDAVVPVANLERLRGAAGDRTEAWRIPGRGHSDPHVEPGFRERITAFFASAFNEG